MLAVFKTVCPWYIRLLAMLALCASFFIYGYIEAKEAAPNVQFAEIAVRRQMVTQNVDTEFTKAAYDLKYLYGPSGVRDKPERDRMPVVSKAAPAIIRAATNPVPSTDQCAALSEQAAITTAQLLYLQDWVKKQYELNND